MMNNNNMFPDIPEDDEDLTEEGEQMWKNIASQLLEQEIDDMPTAFVSCNPYKEAYKEMQIGIAEMIQNSKNVIKDCDEIIIQFSTEKEYLASDAKVAKTMHLRLIDRLIKLYKGEQIFNPRIKLPDIKANPVLSASYYNPKSR